LRWEGGLPDPLPIIAILTNRVLPAVIAGTGKQMNGLADPGFVAVAKAREARVAQIRVPHELRDDPLREHVSSASRPVVERAAELDEDRANRSTPHCPSAAARPTKTPMSHHYSGPNVGFPRGDARLDLTDLFAFPSPGDESRSILIMDAHPSYSLNPAQRTTAEPYAPEAVYELRIDTNGDAIADIGYRLRVSASRGGAQTATLRRAEGEQAIRMGDEGRVIAEGIPVSTGRAARVTEAGDHRLFVGKRSDPFFFDVQGALDDLKFTGDDYFADKDVYSLVLDVPNAALGAGPLGLWTRVLMPADGAGGGWVQVERCARPSQTPFLAGEARLAYLAAEPKEDARFIAVFAHELEHAGAYTPEAAKRAAQGLLPDIMQYDPRRPACYPGNGRLLTDDVMNVFLPILTNGKAKGYKVGPHRDLSAEFPYLGPPHSDG
jgi:hypothetical protein